MRSEGQEKVADCKVLILKHLSYPLLCMSEKIAEWHLSPLESTVYKECNTTQAFLRGCKLLIVKELWSARVSAMRSHSAVGYGSAEVVAEW
jgi:hypothetical protein